MVHLKPHEHEIDAVQKVNALRPVTDGFLQGHHNEPEALRAVGRALMRIAHRLEVCRINRREEDAA